MSGAHRAGTSGREAAAAAPPTSLPVAALSPGSVALVGGGPGALDLITVRGMQLLQQADVVIVDRLGPAALVQHLGEGVEVIEVGKTPGKHSMRQEEIEEILIGAARAGRRVVRLKGGDPFLLGRGGEEVLACRAAGIEVQVVPGVSSAIAGPAAGEVPVTHRGTAVAVHVVNAHGDLGPADLAALRDPGTTTVLMMGVGWLPRLVSQSLLSGIDPQTPVAVVQEATMPGQQVVRGPLATIDQLVREAGIGFPAVIVVGRTAAEGFLSPPDLHAVLEGSGREALAPPPVPDRPVDDPVPASPAPVLVGCAHGTRSRTGRDVIRALLMQVRELLPAVQLREAYVDVQSPDVSEVVASLAPARSEVRTRDEHGETAAVVVPLLLSTGVHVAHDVAAAVRGREAVATGPLGPERRLAEVMAQRLEEAGAGPDHAVVMAAAGTRDPAGVAMARQMADMLGERLGREVTACFVAASRPGVAEAVEQVRHRAGPNARVAVASYLLAPGHFQGLVEAAGADVVAAPLGAHPLIAELITERYLSAVGG